MTFLIADDDARSRESVKRFISKNLHDHHTFIEASNGLEAVELYDRHSPDWVLMDIEMGPMDGLSALKLITATHLTARVIILTFYDDARYRKAAELAGARGFVVKSDLDRLLSLLGSPRTSPKNGR